VKPATSSKAGSILGVCNVHVSFVMRLLLGFSPEGPFFLFFTQSRILFSLRETVKAFQNAFTSRFEFNLTIYKGLI
jgi:hypothetical protein